MKALTALLISLSVGAVTTLAAYERNRVVDEGDLNVTVTQINQQGLFFKTWEISTASGGEHYFTVEDENVLMQLRTCVNCDMRIHYIKRLWTPLRSENGGRFVVSARQAQ